MVSGNIIVSLLLSLLAGASTVFGGFIIVYLKRFSKTFLAFSLGMSAGVMIYVSFMELIPGAAKVSGFLPANMAFFGGIILALIIDIVIPHELIENFSGLKRENKLYMSTGITTAIALAVHNFPEGMAVFVSSFQNIRLGIPLFFAVAIHNIPEGMAVAVPIYFATRKKRKAVIYTFLSGMTEPLGAVIGFLLLSPFLTPEVLSYILAGVAGIMVYISFDELLPVCFKSSEGHHSIMGIITGMAVMALSLSLF